MICKYATEVRNGKLGAAIASTIFHMRRSAAPEDSSGERPLPGVSTKPEDDDKDPSQQAHNGAHPAGASVTTAGMGSGA